MKLRYFFETYYHFLGFQGIVLELLKIGCYGWEDILKGFNFLESFDKFGVFMRKISQVKVRTSILEEVSVSNFVDSED